MLRPNKYRGFYYGGSRKIYWDGQLVDDGDKYYLCSFPSGFFIRVRVEKDSIQECTFLKDRKDVEIYDGDVLATVQSDGNVGFHVVHKTYGGFITNTHPEDGQKLIHHITHTKPLSDHSTIVLFRNLTVVGNVIANPSFFEDYKVSI